MKHTIILKKSPRINTNAYSLRDLYDRKAKLVYWVNRINMDLYDTDKSDVLKLVRYMQDKERASLWIIRCITALISIRRVLGKPFSEATESDFRLFLKWMEQKNYKASTNEKFRQIIKLFYKVAYGNGQYYPDQVKFFSARLGKEKHTTPQSFNKNEYLEESQIIKLVELAPTIQKKAFLACMYESGARPEEFIRMTNDEFTITTEGVHFILRGKTGERRS